MLKHFFLVTDGRKGKARAFVPDSLLGASLIFKGNTNNLMMLHFVCSDPKPV